VPHLIKGSQELDDGRHLSAILDGNGLLAPLGVDVLGLQVCHETEAYQQQRGYDEDSFHKEKLFSAYNLLNVIELIEGFEGSEVVDIEAENLVTNLTEHGVVELEE